MKLGWPLSFVLHCLGLFGGMFAFSSAVQTVDEGKIIPVDIVSVSDFTNVRAAKTAVAPPPIEKPELPMRVETPSEVAIKTAEPEKVEVQPSPSEPETAPQTEPVADAIPAEPVEVAEAPKEPSFDLDRMSALIDQTRSAQPDANQPQALQSELAQYEFAKTARDGAGLQTDLSISEVDALRARMYECWRISVDARNGEDLIIRVRVQLFPDGAVKAVDLLDRMKIASSGDPYVQIAAERALRAVSKCAPYDFLPQDKYASWKDMELSFRPEL